MKIRASALILNKTKMHSSRMRTARSLTIIGTCPGGCLPWGAACPGGMPVHGGCLPGGGVPCDLSHHAFDVTCMLPPDQLSVSTSAAPYIVWLSCMLGYTPLWTEWQTGAKILPCPKLRLRAVINVMSLESPCTMLQSSHFFIILFSWFTFWNTLLFYGFPQFHSFQWLHFSSWRYPE